MRQTFRTESEANEYARTICSSGVKIAKIWHYESSWIVEWDGGVDLGTRRGNETAVSTER